MRHITPIVADLAVPRWCAAGFAKFDSGSSSFRSQNAKPLNNLLCGTSLNSKEVFVLIDFNQIKSELSKHQAKTKKE